LCEYKIFETEQFQKDLLALSKAGHAKVVAKLKAAVYPELKVSPHFGPHIRKLKGYEPETWRYRVGAWRFFFELDDEGRIVFMIGAIHRGAAY
jgi:mRNA interferase RelE/StbE